MRTGVLSLALICLPILSAAQTLSVRSGEHGPFTRLVVDLQGQTDWELEQLGDRAVIRFPDSTYGFDTSAVFDRIDRSRIGSVSSLPGGGGLQIDLACRCEVEAFQSGARMLVLDVRPGNSDVAVAQQPDSPGIASFSSVDLGPRPSLGPRSRPAQEPFFVAGDATRDPIDRIAEDEASIAAIQAQLTLQLARAATSGLLDTNLRSNDTRLTGQKQEPVVMTGDDQTPSLKAEESTPKFTRTDDRLLLSGTACTDDSELNIAEWASEKPFVAQLGNFRQKLLGEFDRPDEKSVLEMAKFYLHFAMGPEARSTLDLLDSPKPALLDALAGIVEAGEDRQNVFRNQAGCATSAAMWAVLAHNPGDDHDAVNTQSLLRGFEELPSNLKTLLATRLSDNLIAMGERQAARMILQRVQQQNGHTDPEVVVARAQMSLNDGDNAVAKRELENVARGDDGVASAEALATLMGLSVAAGTPADEDLAELASAYSIEFRGAEQGPDMWKANVRAMISVGNFDAAFSEMSVDGAVQNDTLEQEFYRALTERANDIAFMKYILRDDGSSMPAIEPDIQIAATERLLALGLPDAAQGLLAKSDISSQNRDKKLLTARIHLAKSEPQDAEIALIGLQGDDVLTLRAEARELMGDYDFAQNAFSQIGEPEQAASAAWISGDWQSVAEGDDNVLASAAQLIQTDTPVPVPGEPPTLRATTALVDASATSIEILRNLLQETRIGPESE